MARVPELDTLPDHILPDGRRLGDAVHIVHVYTVEAHPALPEPTPYKQWTDDELPNDPTGGSAYGDVGQPVTWSGRVANSRRVFELMDNPPLMLMDELLPGESVNPVWSTYGTAPNAAFVIAQDGTIVRAQLWTEVASLRETLEEQVDAAR